jgi:hypothetical protein
VTNGRSQTRKSYLSAGRFAILFGLFIVGMTAVSLWQIRPKADEVQITGTLTSVTQPETVGRNPTYQRVVAYVAPDGSRLTFTDERVADVPSRLPFLRSRVGDTVRVSYPPQDPRRASIVERRLNANTVFGVLVGGGVMALGAGLIRRGRRMDAST